MSVLIKGMEMPTAQQGCMTIRIYYDGSCVRHPQGTVIKGAEAVEVPTPHGRLIDADELKANIHMEGYRGYRARYDGAVTTFNYINDAPTIIEAEE